MRRHTISEKNCRIGKPHYKEVQAYLLKSLIKNNICRKHLLVWLYGSGNPTNPCTKKSEWEQLKYTLFLVYGWIMAYHFGTNVYHNSFICSHQLVTFNSQVVIFKLTKRLTFRTSSRKVAHHDPNASFKEHLLDWIEPFLETLGFLWISDLFWCIELYYHDVLSPLSLMKLKQANILGRIPVVDVDKIWQSIPEALKRFEVS